MNIKPIAFYLPQYHPIPENDEWWEKGFTEWTNVTKAKPLFENHYQPRLPADLGFYDLRVSEARIAQAQLAKQYGIYGFCYWHYWFAGKQILEKPLQEVVACGEPNFPFCVAWANQTWQGTWHGLSNKKILVEQTYPGEEDYTAHFYSLLSTFKDERYIEVNEKKIFMIFQPLDIPDSNRFINCWQNLAKQEGLQGFHFVAMHTATNWNFKKYGYDACIQGLTPWVTHIQNNNTKKNWFEKLIRKYYVPKSELAKQPKKVSYTNFVNDYTSEAVGKNEYPLIFADWDNTARCGVDGWMFNDFSLDFFGKQCSKAFEATQNKDEDEKFVFVKSWNEWAEGNYLEPDRKYGHSYLQTFKNTINNFKKGIVA